MILPQPTDFMRISYRGWRGRVTGAAGPRGRRAAGAEVARGAREIGRGAAAGEQAHRSDRRDDALDLLAHAGLAAGALRAQHRRGHAAGPRPERERARTSSPLRSPPDAITACRARAQATTDTAVGSPQSHSSAPSVAAAEPAGARTASTATQLRAAGARDVDGVDAGAGERARPRLTARSRSP